MDIQEIRALSEANSLRAARVLEASGIATVWREAGCRVNIVGSLRMGLMAAHRDIDLHVYSKNVTIDRSFAIASVIAASQDVSEVRCINGLHTDEHCVAWQFFYRHEDEVWQIDVIHIEEGSRYDGYFEHMADRIAEVMTDEQRDTILRLKFETQLQCDYHGVEYYEAVIADGITAPDDFRDWVAVHREKPPHYWIP